MIYDFIFSRPKPSHTCIKTIHILISKNFSIWDDLMHWVYEISFFSIFLFLFIMEHRLIFEFQTIIYHCYNLQWDCLIGKLLVYIILIYIYFLLIRIVRFCRCDANTLKALILESCIFPPSIRDVISTTGLSEDESLYSNK